MEVFKRGDTIISSKGKCPGVVTFVWSCRYDVKYLHNGHHGYILKSNAQLYTIETTMTETNQLYSFNKEDGSIAYATYLATNSSGQWVVEEKGTGVLHTLSKDSFTEVLPYTFSVNLNGRETHFVSEEGKVQKGEVLFYTGSNPPAFCTVTGVNTKNKQAKAKFKGTRVVTQPF